jgi:hypothetical protein
MAKAQAWFDVKPIAIRAAMAKRSRHPAEGSRINFSWRSQVKDSCNPAHGNSLLNVRSLRDRSVPILSAARCVVAIVRREAVWEPLEQGLSLPLADFVGACQQFLGVELEPTVNKVGSGSDRYHDVILLPQVADDVVHAR